MRKKDAKSEEEIKEIEEDEEGETLEGEIKEISEDNFTEFMTAGAGKPVDLTLHSETPDTLEEDVTEIKTERTEESREDIKYTLADYEQKYISGDESATNVDEGQRLRVSMRQTGTLMPIHEIQEMQRLHTPRAMTFENTELEEARRASRGGGDNIEKYAFQTTRLDRDESLPFEKKRDLKKYKA